MRLILIRHGKTEANEKHLYCGSTDLPLSEAGKAALLGRKLCHVKVTKEDFSLRRLLQSADQKQSRVLPTSRGTQQAYQFAIWHLKAKVIYGDDVPAYFFISIGKNFCQIL